VPESKSSFVRTPNFERLAQGGMRFANFYAPSPRCTPSRVTFFTGKSPAQLHMTFVGEGKKDSSGNTNGRVIAPDSSIELPTSQRTIADLLKRAEKSWASLLELHAQGLNESCIIQ
jgi:arylsulfatase A-like enzyme